MENNNENLLVDWEGMDLTTAPLRDITNAYNNTASSPPIPLSPPRRFPFIERTAEHQAERPVPRRMETVRLMLNPETGVLEPREAARVEETPDAEMSMEPSSDEPISEEPQTDPALIPTTSTTALANAAFSATTPDLTPFLSAQRQAFTSGFAQGWAAAMATTTAAPAETPLSTLALAAKYVRAEVPNGPTTTPIRGTLYGIPPASAVIPTVPSLRRPPRPAYPGFAHLPARTAPAGVDMDADAGVVYCPMSVLVGPISDAAYEEWVVEPKLWFQEKLRGINGVMNVEFYEAVDGRNYARVYVWEMGAWRTVVEMFEAYPCGGNRMWGWRYRERYV
ncbi:hypothetical protein B0T16DRAFT_460443 [Cercophora newfieldiana]|uniref:Uncharacterized protein n=1 Tax=Cercophora newfieldiana TaxID=92897 RepID=A0AA39Y3E8_9PEZI|nr:hypothetical protein B0T16DRAFT_460443 [Cercophora newfieldiana]